MDFKKELDSANDFSDIFHIVKRSVRDFLGRDQAGLLVGLSDLSGYENGFLGAFYSMDANTIVVNKKPLFALKHENPKLYNPYLFHVLLHEYLHSLGVLEEQEVKLLAYEITKKHFGQSHVATQMAFNLEKFMPNLLLGQQLENTEDLNIEFVHGIDRDNTNYIL